MTDHFSSFAAVEEHLEGLGLFRMSPGLERITEVLDRMGLRRPPYPVIQVAGTNGKGSTSAMLAALGQSHGLRTGFASSPHFVTVRERIKVDGRMADQAAWLASANRVMSCGGAGLSYFEFVVAVTVAVFAGADVDLAVMETGLGGTWDATTALEADLAVLTPVALDHMAVLGPDLASIARDKAGIIRPGRPLVTCVQHPEAMREIAARAGRQGAPLILADKAFAENLEPELKELPMRLRGMFQEDNAALALAAWRTFEQTRARRVPPAAPASPPAPSSTPPAASSFLSAPSAFVDSSSRPFSPDLPGPARLTAKEREGLVRAWIPGRMQRIPPLGNRPPLLLDGAHNVHAMTALGHSLARAGLSPAAVIFSCLADKEPAALAAALRVLSTGPVFVPPVKHNPRAMPPADLAALIGLGARATADMAQALTLAGAFTREHLAGMNPEAAAGHPILICGSLYLLGEFYQQEPQWLEAAPE